MKVNKELLRETLQTIKDNPQHWDQGEWHCGSSHCFAGFVDCKVRGLDFTKELSETEIFEITIQDLDELYALFSPNKIDAEEFRDAFNYENNVAIVAQFALCLNRDQAADLFDVSNTLEDLERIVEKLCTQDEESND